MLTLNKIFLYCKKDYVGRKNKIRFYKGEKYYYYADEYSDEDIFVYYNENSQNEFSRGHRFFFKNDHQYTISLVYDYFCTPIEERKLKLEKLNEI